MDYETKAWRAPTLLEGEEALYSEHGRVTNNIDYRSHWFMVTKARQSVFLLVHHGGGQERIDLGYHEKHLAGLAGMTSDERFLLFWTMLDIKHDAERSARESTAREYRDAFVDGRLKKRKKPGREAYKIWIEPKLIRHETEPALRPEVSA